MAARDRRVNDRSSPNPSSAKVRGPGVSLGKFRGKDVEGERFVLGESIVLEECDLFPHTGRNITLNIR